MISVIERQAHFTAGISYREEYKKIIDSLEKGVPPILLMEIDTEAILPEFHAVMIYGVYELSSDIKNIVVYDNNFPGMSLIYQIDLAKNTISSPFIFDIGSHKYIPVYKITNAFVAPPFYADEQFKQILLDFINWEIDRLLIFQSPVNVTIFDAQNRLLSESVSEIPDAKYEYNQQTDAKVFHLPMDLQYSVKIESYGDGECTVTEMAPMSDGSVALSEKTFELTTNTVANFTLKPNSSIQSINFDRNGDGKNVENLNLTKVSLLTPPIGGIKFKVIDGDGNVISNVRVSSIAQPEGQKTVSGTTDSSGLLELGELKPGAFAFKAEISGYESKSDTVQVDAGHVTNVIMILTKSAAIPEFIVYILVGSVLVLLAGVYMYHRNKNK